MTTEPLDPVTRFLKAQGLEPQVACFESSDFVIGWRIRAEGFELVYRCQCGARAGVGAWRWRAWRQGFRMNVRPDPASEQSQSPDFLLKTRSISVSANPKLSPIARITVLDGAPAPWAVPQQVKREPSNGCGNNIKDETAATSSKVTTTTDVSSRPHSLRSHPAERLPIAKPMPKAVTVSPTPEAFEPLHPK
jgi:Type III secretion system regulator (LcrR)